MDVSIAEGDAVIIAGLCLGLGVEVAAVVQVGVALARSRVLGGGGGEGGCWWDGGVGGGGGRGWGGGGGGGEDVGEKAKLIKGDIGGSDGR